MLKGSKAEKFLKKLNKIVRVLRFTMWQPFSTYAILNENKGKACIRPKVQRLAVLKANAVKASQIRLTVL